MSKKKCEQALPKKCNHGVLHFYWIFMLIFSTVLMLSIEGVQGANNTAPNDECEDEDEECEIVSGPCCQIGGTNATSLRIVMRMGACTSCGSKGASGYAVSDTMGIPAFRIYKKKPSPTIFSPQGLNFQTNLNSWLGSIVTDPANLPDGVSREVTLRRPGGSTMVYQFSTDSAVGEPVGKYTNYNTRLIMDDSGADTYYERWDREGNKARFTSDGEFVNITSNGGRSAFPEPCNSCLSPGRSEFFTSFRT